MIKKGLPFLKDFIYLFFREGKGGRKRRGETSMCDCLLHTPLLGTWSATQACALDWDLNQWPFDLQASTQSTEPHQPGWKVTFSMLVWIKTSPCTLSKKRWLASAGFFQAQNHSRPWNQIKEGSTWAPCRDAVDLDHAESLGILPGLAVGQIVKYICSSVSPPCLLYSCPCPFVLKAPLSPEARETVGISILCFQERPTLSIKP